LYLSGFGGTAGAERVSAAFEANRTLQRIALNGDTDALSSIRKSILPRLKSHPCLQELLLVGDNNLSSWEDLVILFKGSAPILKLTLCMIMILTRTT
jgi:hypothetical protein